MTPFDAARALLPAWVIWSPLAGAAAAAALSALVGAAAVGWARRRIARIAPEAHWSERAREVWPVRRAAALLVLLVPAACAALAVGGPISRPSTGVALALAQGTSFAVMLAAAFAIENAAVRPEPTSARLRSIGAYAVIWFPGLTLALLYLAVRGWSRPPPLEVGATAALLLAASLTTAGLRAGILLGLAREAPQRAVRALERAHAGSAGAPPRIVELRFLSANAAAFPLAGIAGVTTGALAHLDDDELAAILAHELAHLGEPRPVKVLRALASGLAAGMLVAVPLLRGARLPVLLAAVLVVLGAVLALGRLLRRLERRADEGAHGAGAAYARALETLYRANLVPAVLRRARTHPHLYDRLVAAGAPPTWARPQPPGRATPVVLGCVLVAVSLLGAVVFTRRSIDPEPGDRGGLLLAVAVQQRAYDVGLLAAWHAERGETGPALVLYGAAEALEPRDPWYPSSRAGLLAAVGRCAEAHDALARAEVAGAEEDVVQAVRVAVDGCAVLPSR